MENVWCAQTEVAAAPAEGVYTVAFVRLEIELGLTTAALVAAFAACGGGDTPGGGGEASAGAGGRDAGDAPTDLLAVVDLPRTGVTESLSGSFYDAATRTLFTLPDSSPRILPLAVSDDFKVLTPGAPISFTGRPGTAWDGEALFRKDEVFYAVTVETTPLVERFDASGQYLGPVPIPSVYTKQASNNKGLESLTLSPSGAYLFTANESALTVDGQPATKTTGTIVRVLRRDLAKSHDEAHAYRTEPLGAGTSGDMGISDLLALSDTELLVLERGYQSDYGSTVRIFRVDYAASGSADVLAAASLDAQTPVLPKTLVLDLATLPANGVTNPGLQPNPILDNYEALALGPSLPDGRRVVFVTSDDNANPKQVPRVVVLAVRGI